METSKTLIEVKMYVRSSTLQKASCSPFVLKKGKLVKEDKVVHAVNDVSFEIKKGKFSVW